MGASAVIVAGSVRVPPENLGALRPVLSAYAAACRAEDGCEVFTFAEDLIEPGRLRVFEVWRDAAALHAHFQTPHVAHWRAAGAALGVHARELTRYDVLGSQPA